MKNAQNFLINSLTDLVSCLGGRTDTIADPEAALSQHISIYETVDPANRKSLDQFPKWRPILDGSQSGGHLLFE
jgi:hypothetical protein